MGLKAGILKKQSLVLVLLTLMGLALLVGCGGGEAASTGTTAAIDSSSTSSTTSLATTTTTAALATTTTPTTTSTTTTTLPPPVALGWGDESEDVERLQTLLTEAKLFRDTIDGVYGQRTAAAVMAFHKLHEMERTWVWAATDWAELDSMVDPGSAPVPDGLTGLISELSESGHISDLGLPERAEIDRIELDLTRQLAFVILDSEVAAIIPISSGNGEYYENSTGRSVRAVTPRGDFKIYKHYEGWRISYLGGLYRPWYFRGGYAIHGSNSVPAYPASHGCVRVPNWEADWLANQLWIGLPVHVWD